MKSPMASGKMGGIFVVRKTDVPENSTPPQAMPSICVFFLEGGGRGVCVCVCVSVCLCVCFEVFCCFFLGGEGGVDTPSNAKSICVCVFLVFVGGGDNYEWISLF